MNIKITPSIDLELIDFKKDVNPYNSTATFKIVGTDYYIHCLASFKDLELKKDTIEEKPTESPADYIIYALYGTGNAYSTGSRYNASINWHWTTNEDDRDLTETQFKKMVRGAAKRAAEREFRVYDPRGIVVKFFKSKDAFLKYCDKIDFHPSV